MDDSDINVAVSRNTVTLTGIVNSWYQREEAERIAYNTPGIWFVNNDLEIDYDYDFAL